MFLFATLIVLAALFSISYYCSIDWKGRLVTFSLLLSIFSALGGLVTVIVI